jgi:CRISPR-associated protein Cas6/Cse3/CasE subtype I-E
MLRDFTIPKPPKTLGYALHRLVSGLADGVPALYADLGDRVLVRTEAALDAESTEVPVFQTGAVTAFELRASTGKKVKGKHRYFDLGDWRSRHEWLRQRGEQLGFTVQTLHCTAEMATIDDGKGRHFTVDQTDFVGVLRVTDEALFYKALAQGVGSTARTFGFGLLIV